MYPAAAARSELIELARAQRGERGVDTWAARPLSRLSGTRKTSEGCVITHTAAMAQRIWLLPHRDEQAGAYKAWTGQADAAGYGTQRPASKS